MRKFNLAFFASLFLMLCILPSVAFAGVKIQNSSAEQDDLDGADEFIFFQLIIKIETSSVLKINDYGVFTIVDENGTPYSFANQRLFLLDPAYEIDGQKSIIATEPQYVFPSQASSTNHIYLMMNLNDWSPIGITQFVPTASLLTESEKTIDYFLDIDELDPVTFNHLDDYFFVSFSNAVAVFQQIDDDDGPGPSQPGGPILPPGQVLRQGIDIPATSMVYPNPIDASSVVRFHLEQAGKVDIQLMNMQGQLVRNLTLPQNLSAGNHQINLNIGDIAKGMYLIRIKSPSMDKSIPIFK